MSFLKSIINHIKKIIGAENDRYIEYLGVMAAIIASIFGFLALEYGEKVLPFFGQLIVVLIEKTFVILGIAYLITKASFFREILDKKFTWKNLFLLIFILGALSIFANHTGADYMGATGNVRDLAPMVGGLVAGPFVGVCVGIIGAVDRFLLGGPTCIPCSLATILAGLFSGMIYLLNKGKFVGVWYAVLFAALFEAFHMFLVLILVNPYSISFSIVRELSLPMVIANSVGMFIFALLISNEIKDRERIKEMELYREEAEIFELELEVAREIQETFWKTQLLEIEGMELETLEMSKEIPPGYFYDVITDQIDKTEFLMGNVGVDGLISSFIGTFILTVVKNRMKNHISLIRTIKFLNGHLSVFQSFKIGISIFMAEFDLKKMIFKYVMLGDLVALFYRDKNGEMEVLNKYSYYLGSKGRFDLDETEIKLEKDDLIIIISYDHSLKLSLPYAVHESLRELIEEHKQSPIKELKNKIKELMVSEHGNNAQICILILKVD